MDLDVEPFDVVNTVQEVAAAVQTLVQKNGNILEVECGKATGTMVADQTKVRQILLNLLSNAAKFTSNGKIVVGVGREAGGNGEQVVFEVRDTGIGIDKERAEKVFEDFTQANVDTAQQYGGTGLGLAITRHFCEMMCGEISLESETGKGSVFTVRLPAEVMQEC